MNFSLLKSILENDVSSVLDIGAHIGSFSRAMRLILPDVSIHMIEPNPLCEEHLKLIEGCSYSMCLLSDKEESKNYLMNKQNLLSTGNSYYRELTAHFADENLLSVAMRSTTLDSICSEQTFDFIKLDTQGSEIDIIRGGFKVIGRAKYVLIECSVQEYNSGSPLVNDVIYEMRTRGFFVRSLVWNHVHEGRLMQQDLLFSRN